MSVQQQLYARPNNYDVFHQRQSEWYWWCGINSPAKALVVTDVDIRNRQQLQQFSTSPLCLKAKSRE